MKLHGNAALSWQGRRRLAERVVVEGWSVKATAEAAGVSVRCARKWVGRFRLEGERGLHDRSSAPRRVANRTSQERVRGNHRPAPLALHRRRDRRGLGDGALDRVGGPRRAGLGKLGRIGLEQPMRYERRVPASSCMSTSSDSAGSRAAPASVPSGASAARGTAAVRPTSKGVRRYQVGYECVHVCIDDYSRLAYAEVLPDERQETAVGFLERAVAFYRRHGIRVERLLTDNGSAYVSAAHALACRRLGIRHLRTRPYRPQTNGKAERFIRTLVAGWAYGAIYRSSEERTAALDGWLWYYNHRRRHSALGRQPPVSRTNVLGSYT